MNIVVDLVKKIPGEFRENEGKNARELVCLRILESLSLLEKGKSSGVLPEPDSSARISPSDHCEDVLRKVQLKVYVCDFVYLCVCFSMSFEYLTWCL